MQEPFTHIFPLYTRPISISQTVPLVPRVNIMPVSLHMLVWAIITGALILFIYNFLILFISTCMYVHVYILEWILFSLFSS